jgi:hypothetical protein
MGIKVDSGFLELDEYKPDAPRSRVIPGSPLFF